MQLRNTITIAATTFVLVCASGRGESNRIFQTAEAHTRECVHMRVRTRARCTRRRRRMPTVPTYRGACG